MINIGVTVDWGKALCEAEILYPAGLGPFKYVFASFPKGQPPTVFKFGEFVIPHEQRFCRKQSEGTTISFPGGDSAALSSSLSGSADGCDTSMKFSLLLNNIPRQGPHLGACYSYYCRHLGRSFACFHPCYLQTLRKSQDQVLGE